MMVSSLFYADFNIIHVFLQERTILQTSHARVKVEVEYPEEDGIDISCGRQKMSLSNTPCDGRI